MRGALWTDFQRVAEQRPSYPAFIQGERAMTFDELRVRANWMGSRLIRRGVRPGDRCLIWAANSLDVATALLACWFAGLVLVIVNDEAPLSHVQHASAVTQPVLILADDAGFSALGKNIDVPVESLSEWVLPAKLAEFRGSIDNHQPASVFFTSGSTGRPKGVTQSHSNLVAGANMVANHLAFNSSDRILCPVPWAFDYGYGQFLSTILKGITQILPATPNTFGLCEAIQSHRPTILAALPALLALLVRGVSPVRDVDTSSLRLITVTGGPVSKFVLDSVRELFPRSAISLNYGMTETYRSASLPTEAVGHRADSVGFAYPGVSLAVLRDDGSEAEPGEIGEIVHRGAGAFLGYWRDPESTRRVLRPDPLWAFPGIAPPMAVFTGDLGCKDEEGYLFIRGRRDRLLKSMGVRISPDEIETIIRGTGLVREAAVVGIPHSILGQMVVAAIVPSESAAAPEAQIKAAIRHAMSRSMLPREFLTLDALPLTPNGKTDFVELVRIAQARIRVWD